jgi:hypothetical protein
MRRSVVVSLGLLVALSVGACASYEPGTLQAATAALGASELKSIEYRGTGKWFQFGQAPNPTLPWPEFTVTSFTASVNYDAPAARVQMERIQVVEPNRARPAPVQQRPVQIVSGTHAWTMAPPAGSAAGTAPQPQPAAVEERTMEIWTTPHGFLKAAAANNATSKPSNGGSEITFTMAGNHKYVGRINAQNQVERVQTWIDNPVLGDTPVEIAYSDYRDFNGVQFPARIVRTQGRISGARLTVSAVTKDPAVESASAGPVRSYAPPPVTVTAEKLAEGSLLHQRRQPSQRRHRSTRSHRRREGPQDEARLDLR